MKIVSEEWNNSSVGKGFAGICAKLKHIKERLKKCIRKNLVMWLLA